MIFVLFAFSIIPTLPFAGIVAITSPFTTLSFFLTLSSAIAGITWLYPPRSILFVPSASVVSFILPSFLASILVSYVKKSCEYGSHFGGFVNIWSGALSDVVIIHTSGITKTIAPHHAIIYKTQLVMPACNFWLS